MGEAIPLNQVARLQQRCDAINRLYRRDNSNYKRAIFVHVDSRSRGKQTDVFFYHSPGSKYGKRLADQLQNMTVISLIEDSMERLVRVTYLSFGTQRLMLSFWN